MSNQKLLLLICFLVSFSGINGQAIIKTQHYIYNKTDYETCSAVNLEFTYPVFYSSNGKALTMINDSVHKLIGDFDFYGGNSVSSIADKGIEATVFSTGTTSTLTDTLNESDCDPVSLQPESSYLGYTIFINTNQLLSFSIDYSYHAGGGGHGGMANTWSFCYDTKEQKWVDLNALFPDRSDTLLLAKTDSLYLDEIGLEAFDESFYFTGDVAIKPGRLVFNYTDRFGATYFYREVTISYQEYEKLLLPRYRKLLKPAVQH
jgi:hypothetical protein